MEETRNIFESLKSSAFDIGKESSLEQGHKIGDYRIICPLSLSGFAELYLAVNTLTKKPYALKLMPPLLTTLDPDFKIRFERAKTVMDKQHAHHGICYIQDAGCDEGYYYIVTDYIESTKGHTYTLHDRLERKVRFTRDKIKRLSIQLCNALEYAHHNVVCPLVHSNLKPSNILFDMKNNPVLTDFKDLYIIGYPYFFDIVKDALHCNTPKPENMEASASGSHRMLAISRSFRLIMEATQLSVLHRRHRHSITGIFRLCHRLFKAGISPQKHLSPYEFVHNNTNKILNYSPVMESYDYMSPEQKAGEEPTEKSNIYSMGLIIYNLLTGTRISGNWNLPSSFGCSRAWDSVIFKCLQFSPEDRYENFTQLKDAISGIDERKNLFYSIAVAVASVLLVVMLMVFSFNFIEDESDSYFIRFKKGVSSIFDPSLKKNGSVSKIRLSLSVEPEDTEVYMKSEFDSKESRFTVPGNKTDVMIEPGLYEIKVSRKGYKTLEKTLTVNDQSNKFTLKLYKEYGFSVKEYRTIDGKKPVPGYLWIIPDSKIEMLPVASSADMPYPVWMGRLEITQQQYESIMWKNPSFFKGDDSLPVNNMSWRDAMEFCKRLSMKELEAGRLPQSFIYRLPLESEWEYCARAGTSTKYFFGDDPEISDEYMWHEGNSEELLHKVGILKPNPWGFYDMLGNAAEWCLDSSNDVKNPELIIRDGEKTHPASYMLRGGSIHSLAENAGCAATEKADSADFLEGWSGFRIVLGPEKPPVVKKVKPSK